MESLKPSISANLGKLPSGRIRKYPSQRSVAKPKVCVTRTTCEISSEKSLGAHKTSDEDRSAESAESAEGKYKFNMKYKSDNFHIIFAHWWHLLTGLDNNSDCNYIVGKFNGQFFHDMDVRSLLPGNWFVILICYL